MELNSPSLECRLCLVACFQGIEYKKGWGLDMDGAVNSVKKPRKHSVGQMTRINIIRDETYEYRASFYRM